MTKVIIHGAVGTKKAIQTITPPWTLKTYEQLKGYTDTTELLAELNGHSSEYYLSLYNSTTALNHLSDTAGSRHSSDGHKYLGIRGGMAAIGFIWETFPGRYIGYNGDTGVWFGRTTSPDAP